MTVFRKATLVDSAEGNEEELIRIISCLRQVPKPFMLGCLKSDVETRLTDKVAIMFRCNMWVLQRVVSRLLYEKLGSTDAAGELADRSLNYIMIQSNKRCATAHSCLTSKRN